MNHLRALSFAAATAVAALSIAAPTVASAQSYGGGYYMTITLEDGRKVKMKVVRMHGRMMVMAPLKAFKNN